MIILVKYLIFLNIFIITYIKAETYENSIDECYNAIYTECSIPKDYKLDDLQEICNKYDKEKCNRLLSKGIKTLNPCKNKDETYINNIEVDFNRRNSHLELLCTRDYEGKLCPYTYYTFDQSINKNNIDKIKFWNYINDSCHSKSCIDVITKALINSEYSNFDNNVFKELSTSNEFELFNKAIQYMKTENCTLQIKKIIVPSTSMNITSNNNNNNTTVETQSNNYSLNYSSALLLTLSLLLVTLA